MSLNSRPLNAFCLSLNLKMLPIPTDERELMTFGANEWTFADAKRTVVSNPDYVNHAGDVLDMSLVTISLPPGGNSIDYCAFSKYGVVAFEDCTNGLDYPKYINCVG